MTAPGGTPTEDQAQEHHGGLTNGDCREHDMETANSPLLTKDEVCELLRCAPRTLDRWRSMWKAKKLNPLGEVKIRRRACFRREAVEKLLNSPRLWLDHV